MTTKTRWYRSARQRITPMNQVRLIVSRETAFVIENQDMLRTFKSTATPEILRTTVDELRYLSAMASNLADKLGER